MTKTILAGIACAALVLPAAAADAPVRTLKAPAKTFNWTGLYAGVNGGYGWGRTGKEQSDEFVDARTHGLFLGGQVGYNHQFNNNFVIGGQLDIDWSNVRGRVIEIEGQDEELYAGRVRYFGTARLQAGFVVNRSFIYVTGGFAFGENKIRAGIDPMFFSASENHTGWAGGFGLEHAGSDRDRFFFEYLYYDLNTRHYDLGGPYGVVPVHVRFNTVRVGYNRGL